MPGVTVHTLQKLAEKGYLQTVEAERAGATLRLCNDASTSEPVLTVADIGTHSVHR